MCGICGWFNFDFDLPIDLDRIEGMSRTLRHRGPDGAGLYADGHFAMAHRRLSIIDLDTGSQPLSNEDGTIWVSFNGEIYNYPELVPILQNKGHRFRTKTDTEVLVHLYEEKGEALLEDLRGMFAFAIWDKPNRRLMLARDRIGKKPLYYAFAPGRYLLFGSEIKALLAAGVLGNDVDLRALDHYLSFLYVPGNRSIFSTIEKLPAAHYLVCENGAIAVKRYWDLVYPGTETPVRSESEWVARFEDVFREAVRIRMRSDVPIGAFLSGGVDSSSVVSVMQEMSPHPVETVTVGFREDDYNELPYARRISRIFGCRFNQSVIEPDIEQIIFKLIHYFDEPFADSSAIPAYYVSQAARKRVTVALSGDGGDEILAGYSRHFLDVLEHHLRKVTRFVPASVFGRIYRRMPPGAFGRNLIGNLAYPPDEAAARKHSNLLFNPELKAALYGDGRLPYDSHSEFRRRFNSCTAIHPLDRSLYLDMGSYLVEDILVKVDRMSMAHSLEVRVPLLDHKVLEFLATLPPHLKLRGKTTKYLLKKMVSRKIPDALINRRKQGFRLPIELWLKGSLKGFAEDLLFGGRLRGRGLFDMTFVADMWRSFQEDGKNYAHQIWQLMILECWFEMYVDRRVAPL